MPQATFRMFVPIVVIVTASACSSPSEPTPVAPTAPATVPVPQPPPEVLTGILRPPDQPPVSATDGVVGRYRLELTIGSGCEPVPLTARTRAYTADIHSTGDASYVVRLYDAKFLSINLTCWDARLPNDPAPTCHRFLASRTGGQMFFDIRGPEPENDNFNGNLIYEALPDGTWVEVFGSASGVLRQDRIEARGSALLSHWQGFPGSSTYIACRSDEFQLTFTRK